MRSCRFIAITCITLLLSACFGPETPQEVSKAFWQAALDGDRRDLARYSTLAGPGNAGDFASEWEGYEPAWGRVIIDGDEATVEAELVREQGSSRRSRSFVTHLVRRDGTWLVHYERTTRSFNGAAFGDLFNQLERLGEEFSRQFDDSADDVNKQMESMLQELDEAQQDLGEQASEAMEKYAEELRRVLQEVDQSLQRALEQKEPELAPKDQRRPEPRPDELEQA